MFSTREIETPLTILRSKFYVAKKKNENASPKKDEAEIFAEALIASKYLDLPALGEYAFSVRKKEFSVLNSVPFSFQKINKTVWEVDLKFSNKESIGTVSFEFEPNSRGTTVTFSNEMLRERVKNKKSLVEAMSLYSSAQANAKAIEEEIAGFLSLHEKAGKNIENSYKNTKETDSSKYAEYDSLLKLLSNILSNPEAAAVTGFDVDKLEGGSSFYRRNAIAITWSPILFVGLAILGSFIYGAETGFGGGVDEVGSILIGAFGSIFLATVEVIFGGWPMVVAWDYQKDREGLAKDVNELIESAQQLSPAARDTIVNAKPKADSPSPIETTLSEIPVVYSYSPVSQVNQNSNGWKKQEVIISDVVVVPVLESSMNK
jgi:hypothetical protein